MSTVVKLQPESRLTPILLSVIAIFYVLYIGQAIVVPLVFAGIIAILLNPVVNFLTRHRFNRMVAIILVLLAVILLFCTICYFIASQASMFAGSLPQLKEKILQLFHDTFAWASHRFNISTEKGDEWLARMKAEGMSSGASALGQTLINISGMMVLLVLVTVYCFMMLLYKTHLRIFISHLFDPLKHQMVSEVILEIKVLIQSFLVGLLLEAAIVAALNSAALLILGVQYAVLIGILGALLNVIPYVGGLIAIAIPMTIAFATQSGGTALWVLVAYLFVQFIDNNFIVPTLVASKVKINGLFSIIVVLIGGALWGVSGMFLAIPLTAILKVVFDRIEQLKPIGFLLGDTHSTMQRKPLAFKLPVKLKVGK